MVNEGVDELGGKGSYWFSFRGDWIRLDFFCYFQRDYVFKRFGKKNRIKGLGRKECVVLL